MEILKLEMEKSKAVLGRAYEDARQHERELETAPKWYAFFSGTLLNI